MTGERFPGQVVIPVVIPESAGTVDIGFVDGAAESFERSQLVFDEHGVTFTAGTRVNWWPWSQIAALGWGAL